MASATLTSLPLFANEPFLDFSDAAIKRQQIAALEAVASELGREYDLVIGGRRVRTEGKIRSVNPARPAELVGVHQAAGPEHAEPAMAAAEAAFPAWAATPLQTRVDFLLRAASLIRERKFAFNAWLVYEVGKNWAEADADTAECIDFLEFYAREALKLDATATPIQLPGERNLLRYIPLGVGAVIPPWNFPFAIMAGMTAAAIVTGNTVILKPSVDAPTIAAHFFAAAGRDRVAGWRGQLLPGRGPGVRLGRCGPSAHTLHRIYGFKEGGAGDSRDRPPRRSRASASSSARSWRWAARTRSSSRAIATCARPWMALSRRRSASTDRSAARARAPSWMRRSTTISWMSCRAASRQSSRAIRRRTSTPDRSSALSP